MTGLKPDWSVRSLHCYNCSDNQAPFAFGITLVEVLAHSADANWKQVPMGNTATQARKVRHTFDLIINRQC
jgi:hypothetical protein